MRPAPPPEDELVPIIPSQQLGSDLPGAIQGSGEASASNSSTPRFVDGVAGRKEGDGGAGASSSSSKAVPPHMRRAGSPMQSSSQSLATPAPRLEGRSRTDATDRTAESVVQFGASEGTWDRANKSDAGAQDEGGRGLWSHGENGAPAAGAGVGSLNPNSSLMPSYARASQGSSAHGARVSSIEPRGRRTSLASMRGTEVRTHPAWLDRIPGCGCVAKALDWLHAVRKKAAPKCRLLNKNKFFQLGMFVALIAALFLPDVWILADRSSNEDLDVILTLVLFMFLVELVVQSIGLTRTYWGSFFFWMDLLGAASLLLDLSYVFSAGDSMSNNVVIMRAARIAKLGARAGRFTKLVKLLRFLPGMRESGADQGTAKVISSRLITALSTRVSCLIIVMVMVMPLFSMWTYPEQDWSMKSFLDLLEKTSSRQPHKFEWQLSEFGSFYQDKDYYPFRLSLKKPTAGAAAASRGELSGNVTKLLPWISPRGPPSRLQNTVRLESENLLAEFNFMKPNQLDSLMNIILLIVVMVLMVGFSLVLSNSVSAIVLRPLEKLLFQVRKMASTIFQSVTDMAVTMKDDNSVGNEEGSEYQQDQKQNGNSSAFGNETELLEKVVQKLAVLSEITMNKSVVDAETMEGLGEGDRAVIQGFQGTAHADNHRWTSDNDSDKDEDDDANFENVLRAQRAMVENAGLSLDLLNSVNLNPLELDKARNHAAAMYFVGPHNHGISFDPVSMAGFLEAAEGGYNKSCPYHNWFHAIDVTHGVYRLLRICAGDAYLNNCERYALLVSAICHDVGHPGLNNTFLIETAHELALRYNDKSPLENMHCARLFEFAAQPKCNIFGPLQKAQFQDVRKTCIDAILHTDNSQHFAMIKEVQMMYEVNSEVLDASREFYNEDPEEFPTKEAVDCFRQPESRKLLVKIMLHLSDVSNSMKPFRICRIWAWQVLEEFFLQGDAEKRVGVPVQALNDREKVNRPFSQIGFIEFLVSPLLFAVIKVLPPTEPAADQMIQNTKTWHNLWQTETKPAPSESEKKSMTERVAKLEAKFLDGPR